MIKALDLLAEDEVLEQCRAAFARAETVLILNGTADIARHENISVIQVELREELFSVGSSIASVTTLETGQFTRHVWTGRMGDANQARTKRKQLHHVDRGKGLYLAKTEFQGKIQTSRRSGAPFICISYLVRGNTCSLGLTAASQLPRPERRPRMQ